METAADTAHPKAPEPVTDASPEGREYELKFALEPRDAERLVSQPALATALSGRQLLYLISTYFDTPEMALKEMGVTLRIRQSSVGAVQTLKIKGGSRVERGEWEAEARGSRPDGDWLQSTPLAALFKSDDLVDALEPQFTAEVSRTTYPLRHDGAEIEAALDNGNIRAKGLSIPVSEFELELKSGPPEAVLSLARQLTRRVPLVLSLASKSERGFGILDLTWGHPTKGLSLDLTDARTIGPAFEAIVQACLHAISVNAALIEGKKEVDAVHKTRVALRRLRAVLQIFAPVLDQRRADRVDRDVKWIWQRLGVARDADIIQEALSKDPEAQPDGRAAMDSIVSGRRAQDYRRLRKALASERWRLVLIDLLELSTEGIEPRSRDARLRPFVEKQLETKRKKLGKASRELAALSPDDLHAVRKKAKTLRYQLEVFASVPKLGDGKAYESLRKQCQRLQQALGTLHDATAIRTQIRQIFIEAPAADTVAPDELKQAAGAAESLVGDGPSEADLMEKASKAARKVAKGKLC